MTLHWNGTELWDDEVLLYEIADGAPDEVTQVLFAYLDAEAERA